MALHVRAPWPGGHATELPAALIMTSSNASTALHMAQFYSRLIYLE